MSAVERNVIRVVLVVVTGASACIATAIVKSSSALSFVLLAVALCLGEIMIAMRIFSILEEMEAR